MSNVRDVKPRVKTITLNDGVEREIRFTLNAMAELEDRYGTVDAAFSALDAGSIKAARCILWAGMLDTTDEPLTEQQVGKLIDIACMNHIMEDLGSALGEDMPDENSAGNLKVVEANAVPNG